MEILLVHLTTILILSGILLIYSVLDIAFIRSQYYTYRDRIRWFFIKYYPDTVIIAFSIAIAIITHYVVS